LQELVTSLQAKYGEAPDGWLQRLEEATASQRDLI
jgi:hypothetical protein